MRSHPRRTRVAGAVATLLLLVGLAEPAGAAVLRPFPNASQPTVGTAVLVLDDFLVYDPELVLADGDKENCTTSSGVSGTSGAGVSGTSGAGPGPQHGEVVFGVLADELDGSPLLTPTSPTNRELSLRGLYDTWGQLVPEDPLVWSVVAEPERTVAAVPVHITDFRLTVATQRVETVIAALRSEGYDQFVINMSFVIVPCDPGRFLDDAGLTLDDLVAVYRSVFASTKEADDFEQALRNLTGTTTQVLSGMLSSPWRRQAESGLVDLFYGTIAGPPPLSPTQQAAFDQVANDPVWLSFADTHVGGSGGPLSPAVVPVGAAGNGVVVSNGVGGVANVRLEFPFAPGLWPVVTSVSGGDAYGKLAAYSNFGEVTLLGDVVDATGAITHQGSSFATPRLAAYQAYYLLAGGDPACGGMSFPPLSYADQLPPSPVNPWRNLPLPAAERKYCPGFLP